MKLVFNRDVVLATGKGFVSGEVLPEGVLNDAQVENFLLQGFLKQVFEKVEIVPGLAPVVEDEEVEEVFDPIESLDPEKKRGRKK